MTLRRNFKGPRQIRFWLNIERANKIIKDWPKWKQEMVGVVFNQEDKEGISSTHKNSAS